MNKKVLVVSASPRKGGNSDLLCNEFIKGANEAGNTTEKVFLADKKINYCKGCGFCIKNDYTGCSQKDDMGQILDKMLEVDAIVFASPVYFYTVNAQMKTFIDRCCAKYTKITNKDFYFIATAAENEKETLDGTINAFRCFLACLDNPKEKGIISGVGAWNIGDIKNMPAMKQAYEMGKNV